MVPSNNTTASTIVSNWAKYGALELLVFVVSFLAITGNALVILTIHCHTRLKTNYYLLILHVAVCDVSMSVTFLLAYVLRHQNIDVFSNQLHTQALLYVFPMGINRMFYLSELLFIILIAVLRYKAVSRPQDYFKRWKLQRIIALIYVISTVVCAIFFVFFFLKETQINTTLRIAIFRITPRFAALLILCAFYYKICMLLYEHGRIVHKQKTKKQRKFSKTVLARQKRNYRVAYKSFVIVTTFLVSNTPLSVWHLLYILDKISLQYFEILDTIIFGVFFVGTCVLNPILYGLIDETLMAGYRKMWKRLKQRCLPTRTRKERSYKEKRSVRLQLNSLNSEREHVLATQENDN